MNKRCLKIYINMALIIFIIVLMSTNGFAKKLDQVENIYFGELGNQNWMNEDEIEELLKTLDYNEITLETIFKKYWNIEFNDLRDPYQIGIIVDYIDILEAILNKDEIALGDAIREMAEELSDLEYYVNHGQLKSENMKCQSNDFDKYLKNLKYCEKMILDENLNLSKLEFDKIQKYELKSRAEKTNLENQLIKWKAVINISKSCVVSLGTYIKKYNINISELDQKQIDKALKIYKEILDLEKNNIDNLDLDIREKKIDFLEVIGFNFKNGKSKNQIKSFSKILIDACNGSIDEFNKFDESSKNKVCTCYEYIVDDIEKGLWNWMEEDYAKLKHAYEEGFDNIKLNSNSENKFIDKQNEGLILKKSDELVVIRKKIVEISKKINELKQEKIDLIKEFYESLED